jgi:hypothetical protein
MIHTAMPVPAGEGLNLDDGLVTVLAFIQID